jgi:hypothetical protein
MVSVNRPPSKVAGGFVVGEQVAGSSNSLSGTAFKVAARLPAMLAKLALSAGLSASGPVVRARSSGDINCACTSLRATPAGTRDRTQNRAARRSAAPSGRWRRQGLQARRWWTAQCWDNWRERRGRSSFRPPGRLPSAGLDLFANGHVVRGAPLPSPVRIAERADSFPATMQYVIKITGLTSIEQS